jgi:5'-3' exonuclease
MKTLLLLDLSSIGHRHYAMSGPEPDPDYTCNKTFAQAMALASRYDYAAICCDSGRSFRADIDPQYKAQREHKEVARHQIALAADKLRAAGFPVWAVKGMEADDIAASAVTEALKRDDVRIVIASSDKDLCALVGPRVTFYSTATNEERDAAAVKAKFGVEPHQMLDYLALCGDKSDNITGAKGIGDKRAAEILNTFPTLDFLYLAIDDETAKFTPAMAQSLAEFRPRMETVRSLIRLRTDVPINIDEAFQPRVAKDVDTSFGKVDDLEDPFAEAREAQLTIKTADEPKPADVTPAAAQASEPVVALTLVDPSAPQLPAVINVSYERQLDPRSYSEACKQSRDLFDSKHWMHYGSPQGILSVILMGREMGLPAMTSLQAFHIIDGRPYPKADLLRGLVLRSGKAKFFRCVERTAESATFETQRGDNPIQRLTYTLQDARTAWTKDEKAWFASGYGKNPADMLVARSSAKLARLEYSDVTGNVLSYEEMSEG